MVPHFKFFPPLLPPVAIQLCDHLWSQQLIEVDRALVRPQPKPLYPIRLVLTCILFMACCPRAAVGPSDMPSAPRYVWPHIRPRETRYPLLHACEFVHELEGHGIDARFSSSKFCIRAQSASYPSIIHFLLWESAFGGGCRSYRTCCKEFFLFLCPHFLFQLLQNRKAFFADRNTQIHIHIHTPRKIHNKKQSRRRRGGDASRLHAKNRTVVIPARQPPYFELHTEYVCTCISMQATGILLLFWTQCSNPGVWSWSDLGESFHLDAPSAFDQRPYRDASVGVGGR